jgi:hypothetical protein
MSHALPTSPSAYATDAAPRISCEMCKGNAEELVRRESAGVREASVFAT